MHQLENGYTQIANSILEELSQYDLSLNTLRVIIWAIRNTYGYKRKHTREMTVREIGKEIDMSIGSVHLALQVLLENGVLSKTKDGGFELHKNKIGFVQPTEHKILFSPLNKSVQPTEQNVQPTEQALIIKKENSKETERKNEGFEAFWNHYPRKVGKGSARKAWGKHQPCIDTCLKALEWQKKSDQWLKDGGQFIPHPSTWLNDERWDDGPPKPKYIHPSWLEAEAKKKVQDEADKKITEEQMQAGKDRYNAVLAKRGLKI